MDRASFILEAGKNFDPKYRGMLNHTTGVAFLMTRGFENRSKVVEFLIASDDPGDHKPPTSMEITKERLYIDPDSQKIVLPVGPFLVTLFKKYNTLAIQNRAAHTHHYPYEDRCPT